MRPLQKMNFIRWLIRAYQFNSLYPSAITFTLNQKVLLFFIKSFGIILNSFILLSYVHNFSVVFNSIK